MNESINKCKLHIDTSQPYDVVSFFAARWAAVTEEYLLNFGQTKTFTSSTQSSSVVLRCVPLIHANSLNAVENY